MGKHSSEVDLLHPLFAQEVPEQLVLRPGVEAVGVEVEALGALLVLDDAVPSANDLVLDGGDLVVAVGRHLDQLDLVLFSLLRLLQVVELAEQARDDFVVQQLVELVGYGHELVRNCCPYRDQ